MNRFAKAMLLSISLSVSLHTQASLITRLNGQALYDTESNLTWLVDASFAITSGYDADGRMNWENAVNWVNQLDIDGVTGWRLPSSLQPDPNCQYTSYQGSFGNNCTGSELGNLFYNVLGGAANKGITAVHNANFSLFDHMIDGFFWTSSITGQNNDYAWGLTLSGGYQSMAGRLSEQNVWAVRDGDIAELPTSQVSEPSSFLLSFLFLPLIYASRRTLYKQTTKG